MTIAMPIAANILIGRAKVSSHFILNFLQRKVSRVMKIIDAASTHTDIKPAPSPNSWP